MQAALDRVLAVVWNYDVGSSLPRSIRTVFRALGSVLVGFRV